jgi:hypothetical protein
LARTEDSPASDPGRAKQAEINAFSQPRTGRANDERMPAGRACREYAIVFTGVDVVAS